MKILRYEAFYGSVSKPAPINWGYEKLTYGSLWPYLKSEKEGADLCPYGIIIHRVGLVAEKELF